jgi:cobalt-zinc-cadmium efflux system protein
MVHSPETHGTRPSRERHEELPEAGRHSHLGVTDLPESRIRAALILTLGSMVVEVVGGLLSHSLALLSDAGHMASDAGALALALFAQRVASRPHTAERTYGSHRAETLAAFVNGIALGVTAVFVVVEAVSRWRNPPEVHGPWMLALATGGLAVNMIAAWLLSHGQTHNANTRAALAHVLSDAAGSCAAMLAGFCVLAFGWNRADPAISIVISLLILWSAWKLIQQTTEVLMEGIPSGLEIPHLEETIRGTPGVANLHDLHAWTISEGFNAVTVHVVLDGTRHGTEVAQDVVARIRRDHGITHVTVQPEPPARELVEKVTLSWPK